MPENDTRRVRYTTRLDRTDGLSSSEAAALQPVADRYAYRINDYYAGLIDWDDPADPLRRLVVPHGDELAEYGALDASNEEANTVARGCQHKYVDTALLLCNEVCGAYCRYCFRKRLFMNDNDEATNDVSAGIEYIAAHPEITNVLLTGGDPLLMSTRRLQEVIQAVRMIDHVRIIRIGSKMPAFDPWRLQRDPELAALLSRFSTPEKRIYLMAHFDHPRELTAEALAELDRYQRCGVIAVNQCPLIRGINDDPAVLAEMWNRLAFAGVPPYYLFQGRPTAGNAPYEVPLETGWRIYDEAMRRGSGLSRRARYVMSHDSGKIEILEAADGYARLRYHQAKNPADLGVRLMARCPAGAAWFDDLDVIERLGPAEASPTV